jgi:hypothetical protein
LGIPNVINDSIPMSRLTNSVILLILVVFAISCKKKDNEVDPEASTRTAVLVSYPWRLKNITNVSGAAIPSNQLNSMTKAIYDVSIAFTSDNKVKAFDALGSNQVVNGGTWYLVENNTKLDIDVLAIKGKFPIVELTNSKMSLRMKVPVNSVEEETHMIFEPIIK